MRKNGNISTSGPKNAATVFLFDFDFILQGSSLGELANFDDDMLSAE